MHFFDGLCLVQYQLEKYKAWCALSDYVSLDLNRPTIQKLLLSPLRMPSWCGSASETRDYPDNWSYRNHLNRMEVICRTFIYLRSILYNKDSLMFWSVEALIDSFLVSISHQCLTYIDGEKILQLREK